MLTLQRIRLWEEAACAPGDDCVHGSEDGTLMSGLRVFMLSLP